MADYDVFSALATALRDGKPCALLLVADSKGSSPGKTGALMAMDTRGALAGSIGGGLVESQLIDRIPAILQRGQLAPHVQTFVHRVDDALASGMICGGQQQVAIVPLHLPQQEDIADVARRLDAGERVTWTLDNNGWQLTPGKSPSGLLQQDDTTWSCTHCSGPSHDVVLIGGGHVSLALSAVLRPLEFRITVIEEREHIASFAGNRFAHHTHQCRYEDIAPLLSAGKKTLVGIMTHDSSRDVVALSALKGMEFGYLGLLGSRRKRQQLLGARALPDFFRAPMGLPIHSHRPEEIAISIAAELIALRNHSR